MDTDFDAAAERIMDFYRAFSDDKVEEFIKLSSAEIHWEDPFGETIGMGAQQQEEYRYQQWKERLIAEGFQKGGE